jgi:two-component system cell cycle sensor histidine kinase/response regulator CckA
LEIEPGEFVRLDVSDEGDGIPPDVLVRIFDPFYTTKGEQGNGLGLATVRAIMLKAGGTVNVTSALGQGTTFSLWFPRSRLSVTAPAVETHDDQPVALRRPAHVLVCEDEPAIRRVVGRTLRSAGCSVTECATVEDALARLAEEPAISLLITDVVMPGMSGIELMRAARLAQPQVSVMLMTGYSEELVHTVDPSDRPDFMLAKPFRGEDLVREAQRLIER